MADKLSSHQFNLVMLLLCGDISTNPGPIQENVRGHRFTCELCQQTVIWNQKALCCDNCGKWFHFSCQVTEDTPLMPDLNGSIAFWECQSCDCPNYSTLLSYHTINTSNSFSHLDGSSSMNQHSTSCSPGKPVASSSPKTENSGDINNHQSPKQPTRRGIKVNQNSKFCPLRLLNINARSIRNKKPEFLNLIETTVPDIIVCTESWLNDSVTNGEMFPPNLTKQYNVFRRDRSHTSGGGVFIAVSSDLISTRKLNWETDCEMVWVEICVKGCKNLYVCAFYNPHEGDERSYINLKNSLSNLQNIQSHIWIAGDFNLPGYDWKRNGLKLNCHYPDLTMKYIDLFDDHSLTQIVKEPTRGENILDLFATNNASLIKTVSIIPGISDHDIVYIEGDISPISYKQQRRKIFLYKRADWEGLRANMSSFCSNFVRSSNEGRFTSVNMMWMLFKNELQNAIEKFIPSKQAKSKNKLPYVDCKLRRLMRKRDKLHRKKDPRYKILKREVQKSLRAAYWKYVEEVITPADDTPEAVYGSNKRFWSLFKHAKADSTGIPSLKSNGLLVSDAAAKASLLNSTFFSAFTDGSTDSTRPFHTSSPHPIMPEINITEPGIVKLLENLSPHKAAGTDNIQPMVLKQLATIIAPILKEMFVASLKAHEVPDDWKLARITPVFKKGDKDCAVNYRPISLTCICSKIMEHIITSNVMHHLEHFNILHNLQHGFRSGRSCETQLLELTTTLHSNLAARTQTDLVVLDFSKAFDKVSHSKLLSKLEYYGISGDTHMWIQDFLQNRQQCVVVDNAQSPYLPVLSGVPQGSVIGPALFLIFINDLPEYVLSNVHLFADDTALLLAINSKEDSLKLQADLQRLEEWEHDWQMSFNLEKCEVLRISRKRQDIHYDYVLHGVLLRTVTSSKYLGVHLTKDLKWNTHISNITAKGNKTLGFLKRNLKVRSPTLKEKAYKTILRPKMEYCSTIWDPRKGVESHGYHRVEMVQRRAARWVMSRYQPQESVTAMIDKLGWDTLEKRRAIARVTLLYKIVKGLVVVNTCENLQQPTRKSRHNKDHSFKQIACKTEAHRLSFYPRTIEQWNTLPENVFLHATNTESFKRMISKLITT